ncbi:MAG TPA: hypothetical protein VFO33_04880 [Casimicrobiaceae bacterium]|nr:hypothetical protein [Casimicrobiaceae bacterium]
MTAHRTALALACAIVAACAEKPLAPGEAKSVAKQDLAPYAMHEDCAELAPGDRLDYRFESTQPLKFNIHYHDGNMVLMPITRDDVTSDAGVFAPQSKQGYCLMWEAGAAGATIAYRMQVRRRAP